MGLAGPGRRPAVEEPKAAGVGPNHRHTRPVTRVQPTALGLPAPGDHQQMAGLNRILVEDHHVIVADLSHLKRLVPGKERIGLWALGLKVPWRA